MLSFLLRWRVFFFCLFLACAGMIGFAMYHQIYNWVMPCLLCVYQRIGVIAIGLLALIAAIWKPGSRAGVGIIGTLIGIAALYTAGMAAWNLRLQYGPPDPSVACASSLPFPIDLNAWPAWVGMLIRPVGDCSQINFSLFGVSVPVWMLLAALAIAGFTAWACVRYCREIARRPA
ncbi:disulfide bond formation protein B [Andreprevotia chitinilytica]|uniref:disulfide bond formation protein B n=1 Tax=Andreprevotia chitinilytica TaxID=396808 RepID=UPI000550B5A5|nr:disulfide bond formation protein B [Andreprevotia chitinilytica]